MLRMLLIVLAVLLVIGMLPAWPYSAHWGYFPSGGALLIAVIALALLFSSRGGDIV